MYDNIFNAVCHSQSPCTVTLLLFNVRYLFLSFSTIFTYGKEALTNWYGKKNGGTGKKHLDVFIFKYKQNRKRKKTTKVYLLLLRIIISFREILSLVVVVVVDNFKANFLFIQFLPKKKYEREKSMKNKKRSKQVKEEKERKRKNPRMRGNIKTERTKNRNGAEASERENTA